MRTPAQMAREINDLNCHVLAKSPVEKDGKTYDPSEVGYGPVTVAQMEAIYKEARKIEWTDKKPDKPGWWALKNADISRPVLVSNSQTRSKLVAGWSLEPLDEIHGQWSTRPIDMPEEARKELSK